MQMAIIINHLHKSVFQNFEQTKKVSLFCGQPPATAHWIKDSVRSLSQSDCSIGISIGMYTRKFY